MRIAESRRIGRRHRNLGVVQDAASASASAACHIRLEALRVASQVAITLVRVEETAAASLAAPVPRAHAGGAGGAAALYQAQCAAGRRARTDVRARTALSPVVRDLAGRGGQESAERTIISMEVSAS